MLIFFLLSFLFFRAFEGLLLHKFLSIFNLFCSNSCEKYQALQQAATDLRAVVWHLCTKSFFFGAQASFSFVFSDENKLLLPGNVGHIIQTIRLEKRENPCREVLETGP